MGRRLPNSGYAPKECPGSFITFRHGGKETSEIFKCNVVDVFSFAVLSNSVYKDVGVCNRIFLPDISSFNHSAWNQLTQSKAVSNHWTLYK